VAHLQRHEYNIEALRDQHRRERAAQIMQRRARCPGTSASPARSTALSIPRGSTLRHPSGWTLLPAAPLTAG